MKKTLILLAALALLLPATAKKKQVVQQTDREYWTSIAWKMAQPVLENMSKSELQKNMKTEFSPSFDNRDRSVVYMETFGRLMAGIAPWLSLLGKGRTEPRRCRLYCRVVPPCLGHPLDAPRRCDETALYQRISGHA